MLLVIVVVAEIIFALQFSLGPTEHFVVVIWKNYCGFRDPFYLSHVIHLALRIFRAHIVSVLLILLGQTIFNE